MLALVNEHEGFQTFAEIVRDILPRHSEEIIATPEHATTITLFRRYFEEEYFPLLDFVMEIAAEEAPHLAADPWESLIGSVPVELHGFMIEDVHEHVESIRSTRLPASLTILPILLPMSHLTWEYDDGVRVSWLEEAANRIPRRILAKIPPDGFEAQHLLETFPQTDPDLHNYFLWALGKTPYDIINFQYHPDEYFQPALSWDREEIEIVAQDWRDAQPILQSVRRAMRNFDEDPADNLDAIIEALLDNLYPWTRATNE